MRDFPPVLSQPRPTNSEARTRGVLMVAGSIFAHSQDEEVAPSPDDEKTKPRVVQAADETSP